MATFFGEVLPVISRAVDDEDDELPVTVIESTVQFNPSSSFNAEKLQVGVLVVATGSVSTSFLNAYCVNTDDVQSIGHICETSNLSELDQTKEEKVCSIYVRNDNISSAFCLASSSFYLNPEKLWLYVDQIFRLPFCDSVKEAVVLDSCSIRQYLTHEREDELPVVRSIWTRNYAKKKIFPSVKQPNTVNGLAAAVLTKCELLGIPAILHVCYTDSLSLTARAINAFAPILHEEYLHYDKERNDSIQDRIKSIVSSHGSEHSLYV